MIKKALLSLLSIWLLIFSTPLFAAKATILCYHTFLGKPKIFTDFSIPEFQSHIQLLQSKGFKFITLKQLEKKQYSGDKNIVIILDDGNISAYTAYKKVLQPAGIKPVFAIYPGIINRLSYAMTWAQLNEAVKNDCDIASHGYFHQYLSSDYAKTHPKEFKQEIVDSKKLLEEKLGIQVPYLVYPFGVVSPEAKALIKKTGYRYAFSLKAKPVELALEDRYDMPRYMMTRSMAKGILQNIVQ